MTTLNRRPRIHVALCWNCRQLLTREERADGVCGFCADGPAVLDVHPSCVVAWAMATAHGTSLRENIESVAVTINAWNACTDKNAFLNQ